MPITYPLEFPSELYTKSLQVKQVNSVSRSESPFDLSDTVYDWGGEMWAIEGPLPPMLRDSAASYIAFVAKLKGIKGSFLFPVHEPTPRGVATGLPVIDGAGQTGNTINVRGFTSDTINILREADYIQIGSGLNTSLHMVLSDADTDVSGNTPLTLWPSLRSSPADGEPVVVSNCKGLFRLSADTPHNIDTNRHYTMKLSAYEVINGA